MSQSRSVVPSLAAVALSAALLGCGSSPSGPDPCAPLDAATARHVADARARGLSDAEIAQHRQAMRAALRAELAPSCPEDRQ